MVDSRDVQLQDGRTLRAYDAGAADVDAPTLIWHHGSPQTGAPLEPAARRRRAPGDSLGDVRAPELRRLEPEPGPRRRLGGRRRGGSSPTRSAVERFAVMGASGGGPHALACAALLGDRVIGAVTLAGIAPVTDELRLVRGDGRRPAAYAPPSRAARRGPGSPRPRSSIPTASSRPTGRRSTGAWEAWATTRARRRRGHRRADRRRRRDRRAVGIRPRRGRGAGADRPGWGGPGHPALPRRLARCAGARARSCGCARATATSRSSTRPRWRWTGCAAWPRARRARECARSPRPRRRRARRPSARTPASPRAPSSPLGVRQTARRAAGGSRAPS